MKSASESTWSFQLIIFFILIFACFLTLVINYYKAFIIKNNVLSMVEKYEGVSEESATIINNYIYQESYRTRGKCPANWVGALDYENNYELADGASDGHLYCYREVKRNKNIYYEVMFFYKFNLPIIGDINTFSVKGRTQAFVGNPDRLIIE